MLSASSAVSAFLVLLQLQLLLVLVLLASAAGASAAAAAAAADVLLVGPAQCFFFLLPTLLRKLHEYDGCCENSQKSSGYEHQ